jgi:hypothetical protein
VLPREELIKTVRQLVEQLYLESPRSQANQDAYITSSETEKRTNRKAFARDQAVDSNRWADILQNLLSADLDG